jgi:hypothetical protein
MEGRMDGSGMESVIIITTLYMRIIGKTTQNTYCCLPQLPVYLTESQ